MPLAAGLVRGFNVDRLDKLPQRIGGKLVQVLIFAYPLDKLLQIFNLSFLFNELPALDPTVVSFYISILHINFRSV